jgi:hypothetical protein
MQVTVENVGIEFKNKRGVSCEEEGKTFHAVNF